MTISQAIASQGSLTNGAVAVGSIAADNPEDDWTFNAAPGQNVIIRYGAANLYGQLALAGPDGSTLATAAFDRDLRIEYAITNSGTFTVKVTAANAGQTGDYQLYFAKPGDPLVIPPGDDGGPMSNGAKYHGTITEGDLDLWTFSANAGQTVSIRFGSTNFSSEIDLFDASGAKVFSVPYFLYDFPIQFTATNSGVFTVVIGGGYNNSVGDYDLYFAKPGDPLQIPPGDAGGSLTNGARYDGHLAIGEIDEWTFAASSGETVLLRLASTNFVCQLNLFDANGALIASTGANRDVELSYTATNSGVFTAIVASYYSGDKGAYSLFYAKPGDPLLIPPGSAGGSIANGGRYVGNLALGELNQWTFAAAGGDTIILRMASTNFPCQLRLFDASGALVSTSGVDLDVELLYAVTNSGTFTAIAGAVSGSGGAGPYSLFFAKPGDPLAIPAGDDGGPLANGGRYDGVITLGDIDQWTFDAQAGQAGVIRFGSPDFQGILRLFGPAGFAPITVTYNKDLEINYKATVSGSYVVVVDGLGAGAGGNYRIYFAEPGGPLTVPPGGPGGPIANGGVYGAATGIGEIDEWTFDGQAGETVQLRFGSADFQGEMQLFDPSGAQIAYVAYNYDEFLQQKLTNSGVYTLVAGSGQLGVTGAYRLSFAKPPAPPAAGPMFNGGNYEGTILLGGMDEWTFSAQPGETAILRLSSPYFQTRLDLFDPNGILLQTGQYVHDIYMEQTIASAGTYTAVVSAGNLDEIGGYRLCFVKPGDPADPLTVPAGDEGGPLANGVSMSGFLTLGDLDAWTFSAKPNEHILLRYGSRDLAGRMALYKPDGSLAAGAGNDLDMLIDYGISTGGLYTVVVSALDYDASGAYRLTLAQPSQPIPAGAGVGGGALASGGNHDGVLQLGGMDFWTFNTASNAERIFLRCGSSNLDLRIDLFDGSGALLQTAANAYDLRIDWPVAANTNYTVVVSNGDRDGTGGYRLRYAASSGPFVLPPGESGGGFTAEPMEGELSYSDQNLWRFAACEGRPINIALTTTNFTPRLYLFGPDGSLFRQDSGRPSLSIQATAPTTGVYLVFVDSTTAGRFGSYQLAGSDLLGGPILCPPAADSATLTLAGVGGVFGGPCVLYTTTNIVIRPIVWTPFLTNQFDAAGFLNVTVPNPFGADPSRFFRISAP